MKPSSSSLRKGGAVLRRQREECREFGEEGGIRGVGERGHVEVEVTQQHQITAGL